MAKGIRSGQPRQKHFIKEWREHRALTQLDLAEKLSTTKQSIQRIETGEQVYTQESLEGLAWALDCTPADLIARDPNEPVEEPEISLFDLEVGEKAQVKAFIQGIRAAKAEPEPPAKPARRKAS